MDQYHNTLQNEEESLSLSTLASMRSHIINPSTPQSTLCSILQKLTCSLELSHDKVLLHYSLNLLTHLAFHHSSFSHSIFQSVCSHPLLSAQSTRLAVDSLQVLALITERVPALGLNMDKLDDGFFVSLCFGPSVSARLWLLNNAGRFQLQPSLLFTVFLGFTKDPYPYVRKACLDGLVDLINHGVFEDSSLADGCYHCAVQLLGDMEDCVRSSAIRVVSSWGLMLAASDADMKSYWSNEVFAKLCSMARDMSMEVRVEAFCALGKIEIVSEDLLLQTLSKRVLEVGKKKEVFGRNTTEQFKMLAASVAGALVHGLEDEFFEVRKSACQSLQRLAVLSAEFAHEALNILMDVLNDDSVTVRLQALKTMYYMATSGCLKVQEKHLHMFIGVLADNNREVRCAARKIFKQVKLNSLLLFKSAIDGLLDSLNIYPQDEADVFSAVSHIGRNHQQFVAIVSKEVFEEVEAAFEGNSEFNSARVAALLVLCVSASLSRVNVGTIPPILFSYAVTLLGRIYSAFIDVMDRDALLAYLSDKSRSIGCLASDINHGEGEQQLPLVQGDYSYCASIDVTSVVETSHTRDVESETQSHFVREPKDILNSQVEQRPVHDEVIKFTDLTLLKVPGIWSLIQSGFTSEVLQILSGKEDLATMRFDTMESADALAFTLQYLRIIKGLAKIWGNFFQEKLICSRAMGAIDFELAKLDRRVKEFRYRFIGFSPQEELNVLELMLVTCVLRLCKVDVCCRIPTSKRLTAIFSHVEFLLKERSVMPSTFIIELRKLLSEGGTSINDASQSHLEFYKCLESFSLKQFVCSGTIRHVRAELSILSSDSEHPLPFVSGLPVGIECDITLHNITNDNRLWLSMTMNDDGSTQYVFLDWKLFEGSGDQVRNSAFVAPFYGTPKATSFRIRVCIGLECLFEDAVSWQTYEGPRHELTFLCPEKEVYLSNVQKTKSHSL
ncbi:protein SIEL-like [Neltuma alba]|uniref:protein SIEL-like n=1 Tax=Neltuma alba TaxID=207710 RepID=UPI0010A49681|nr:protein SIEL-like [Prosopis alba]